MESCLNRASNKLELCLNRTGIMCNLSEYTRILVILKFSPNIRYLCKLSCVMRTPVCFNKSELVIIAKHQMSNNLYNSQNKLHSMR